LLSSTQATEAADYIRFNRDAMKDLQRNVLGTLMNSYRFFKMYADIDQWKPANFNRPASDNTLDQWILARLDEAIEAATASADQYKIAHALEPVFSLINDLSNWYIRRSRRRFWKSEDDKDKQAAYATLWYVLIRISQLMAPYAPFISDYFWRNLKSGEQMPESVHLSDWPSVNKPDKASQKLLDDMRNAREYIADGLSKRAAAGVKVRQPLSEVLVPRLPDEFRSIIAEELNVKDVAWAEDSIDETPYAVKLNTEITPELKAEGLVRELIRHIQNARKNAGFKVEDRIQLALDSTSEDLKNAYAKHKDGVMTETLATAELTDTLSADYSEKVKVDGAEATLWLKKA
jgi:isoleucyl-tRNA synthetase